MGLQETTKALADPIRRSILNLLKKLGKVKVSRLVALFMKDHYLDAFVIAYLINRLIEKDRIKVISVGERFFENVIAINE